MLDGLLQRLVSRSFRRGLGGEPVWLAVGAAAWLVVRSRRRDRPVVWSGRLEEGQWADTSGSSDLKVEGRAHQHDGLSRVAAASGLLADGEQVLVIDPKGRRYLSGCAKAPASTPTPASSRTIR